MLNISWAGVNQQQWDQWHRIAGGAIQQHWAYGAAICDDATHRQCARAVVTQHGQTVAIAQILVRTFGPLKIALCSRGPVWMSPPDAQTRAAVYAHLKQEIPIRGIKMVFMSPDDSAESAPGTPPGTQKLRRILTGYSTVRLDLTQTPEQLRQNMHPKWRNRLVAAEASALRVNRNSTKPARYQWLLEREGLQRQQRAYQALPAEFIAAYQQASIDPSGAVLVMRADIGKEPVAAMMFLVHGTSATYHLGWSDQAGRHHNAHNLLLWQAMLALKQAGVHALDMGGVNTQRGAGIARFKIGVGGQVQTFTGTYC